MRFFLPQSGLYVSSNPIQYTMVGYSDLWVSAKMNCVHCACPSAVFAPSTFLREGLKRVHCIEGMDRVIGPFPSNPSGPFWDLGPSGPSVLFWGFLPRYYSRDTCVIKFSYTYNRITTFFCYWGIMHSFKESCAGAETRSTGTRRSLLRGRGAHPATACASPSPSSYSSSSSSYSSSSSSFDSLAHYTQRLAKYERWVTYFTSAALDEEDDVTMVMIHKCLADASAEMAKLRLLILHETARRIRPHSLVDTSGACVE
jgi:hypothetical protein